MNWLLNLLLPQRATPSPVEHLSLEAEIDLMLALRRRDRLKRQEAARRGWQTRRAS